MLTLAANFAHYLSGLTGVAVSSPATLTSADDNDSTSPIDHSDLLQAIERLDHALNQVIDLASVYGDDPRLTTEPLIAPVAALAGAYLQASGAAAWIPRSADASPVGSGMPDEEIAIATPNGYALDLMGVARVALFSGAPNLRAIVAQTLQMDAAKADAPTPDPLPTE